MTTEKTIRTYTELSKLETFKERFEYCKVPGTVGTDTFGYERYLNQTFYTSPEWRSIRRQVILRDNGCDLGVPGHELNRYIYIHHLNPITKQDILDRSDILMNPEYLICVSRETHNAIHFGDASNLIQDPIERRPNDTCPWK